MPTVMITGGTGTIGKRLSQMLVEKGYEVIILSRRVAEDVRQTGISFMRWDVENGIIDRNAIAKADYIIHLAGAGVADKRWSAKRKKEIQESRTKSSALLVKSLKENDNKVTAVISSSAIGWYGQDHPSPTRNSNKNIFVGFDEAAPSANNFLGDTCRLWEESILPVVTLEKRLVIVRTGIVLSNEGGAFAEFKKPLKAGIAAIIGSGEQMISWIHVDDICRIFLFAIENKNVSGIFNGVAPAPVSNKTLVLLIAKALRGNFYIPIHVPSFILKLMLGEMSVEVLKSTTVSAAKIKSNGFQFLYPSAEAAVGELVK